MFLIDLLKLQFQMQLDQQLDTQDLKRKMMIQMMMKAYMIKKTCLWMKIKRIDQLRKLDLQ